MLSRRFLLSALPNRTRHTAPSRPASLGVSVLVVDDEEDARLLLKTILSRAGATGPRG